MDIFHKGASDPHLRHRNVIEQINIGSYGGGTIRIEREEAWIQKEWELQNNFIYMENVLVGYLRTVTYDEELYALSFPTIYDYLRKKMMYYSIRGEKDLQRMPEADILREKAERRMEMDKLKFGIPYIDDSYIGNGLDPMFPVAARGQGLGIILYAEVARMLGREGKVLRGSDTFSEQAASLWDKLEEQGYPVLKAEVPFGKGLDYTCLHRSNSSIIKRG